MADNEARPESSLGHPRARQFLIAAKQRDCHLRATSHEALVVAGRGVRMERSCYKLPVDGIAWSKAAREALPKRGTP